MRVHMKKYLFVVLLVGVCFSQTDIWKYNQELQQYEKESSERNKKRLIKEYGEEIGSRISKRTSWESEEKRYLRLIEKYGKDEAGRIFNSRLSKEEYFKKQKEIQRLEEIEKQKRITEEIEKQKEIQRLKEIEKQKEVQRLEEIEKENQRLEKQKEIKTFLFLVTVVAVSIIILIIVVKKERKNRKDKLIKLYGEKDGLNIFYKKISESSFKEEIQRNELIDKHGEELGLEIFNSNLSEDEFFKKDLKTETIGKEQAKEKLKEAKENLDLELITQKEYDVLKEELKPIIMSESDDLKPSEKIGKDEKNTSKKGSSVMGWVVSMSLLGGGLGWILTSGGSSITQSYKYTCEECGDKFSSAPYQCIFYNCFQDRDGYVNSGMDTYCSCSCGIRGMRKNGFRYECR